MFLSIVRLLRGKKIDFAQLVNDSAADEETDYLPVKRIISKRGKKKVCDQFLCP